MKYKKIFLNTFFVVIFSILPLSLNWYHGLINTPISTLHNFTLASLTLDNFVSTDSENKVSDIQSIRSVFVENVYYLLFINDLTKNEILKNILSKPFNNLWLTIEFLLNFGKKFFAVICSSTKLTFVITKIFVFNITFLTTLFFILSFLKPRHTAPLVFRC
jgi:hypothetical protein